MITKTVCQHRAVQIAEEITKPIHLVVQHFCLLVENLKFTLVYKTKNNNEVCITECSIFQHSKKRSS